MYSCINNFFVQEQIFSFMLKKNSGFLQNAVNVSLEQNDSI